MNKFQQCSSEFAMNLYQVYLKCNDGNVFISPYSISAALTMVLLGARGNTATELKNVLKLNELSEQEIHSASFKLFEKLTKQQKYVSVEIANRLFADQKFTLVKEFKEKCKDFYAAAVGLLDFANNSEMSRLAINDWAQKVTKDKIKDLMPSGCITALTNLVIANAVYFKGDWMDKFNEHETVETMFHVSEKQSAKVKMMCKEQNYNFAVDTELQVNMVELPYKGRQFSMVVFLPCERYGLKKVENNLTTTKIQSLLSQLRETNIILGLPKMQLEHQVNLVPPLQSMEVADLFDETRANLQGLSSVPSLYVSGIFHKAFIEVNEEGSEAAAATGLRMAVLCVPPPAPRVVCDHPFMFMIRHIPTNAILFLGRFVAP